MRRQNRKKSSTCMLNQYNVRVITTTYKNEDFLSLLYSIQKYGYNVSVILATKFQKHLYNSQDKIQEDLNVFFQKMKVIPYMILTDSQWLKEEIIKTNICRYIYLTEESYSKITKHRNENLKRSRSLGKFCSPTTNSYTRTKICVQDFLLTIPRFSLFFTALGHYRKQFNFEILLDSFEIFQKSVERLYSFTVVLVLGGYFKGKDVDKEYYSYLESKVKKLSYKTHVVLLQTITLEEKKALLRLSYALLYFNDFGDQTFDVKLATQVGTPIIGINNGYLKNETLPGFLVPLHINTIVACMKLITKPTIYDKASRHARLYYLKHFTKFSQALEYVTQPIKKIKGVPGKAKKSNFKNFNDENKKYRY